MFGHTISVRPSVGPVTQLYGDLYTSPSTPALGSIYYFKNADGLQELLDSRHSIGVRMRKKGRALEDVARQLGTSLYQVATVYANIGQGEADAKEANA